ncbi:pentatricopeptide repeat domain-containing protein [Diaporthe amygdali]|uniref:pentatricopeptide repeat domain-containing protein n=1 Tax=Phomopsis amygdali TaxID=1214568 RepID=UPI0022FE447D|nr:pentatricopeptide repeat domain-containing protein [Diaporthe amygdali]KAJ0120352.1 pentatricopeptide repeat domain-containing protein [Diaporthe amygdali]
MRSSLTRNVYQRMLACHGLPSAPASVIPSSSSRPTICPHRTVGGHPSRRTFMKMNLFKKPPREVKDSVFEPGFGTFVEFRARSVENVQLPSREELIDAFRTFFDYKVSRKKPLNSTQAFCARLLVTHLQDTTIGPSLAKEDLQKALFAVALPPERGSSKEHIQFATQIYHELNVIKYSGRPTNEKDRFEKLNSDDLERYIVVLIRQNATKTAMDTLLSFQDLYPLFDPKRVNQLNVLRYLVLKGLAKEGDEAKLREFADELLESGYGYSPDFHATMSSFYGGIDTNGEGDLRTWFEKPIHDNMRPRPDAYMALIKFSTRTKSEPDWLKKALQELCDSNPPKAWWDVILTWAVYQGRDIDHIRRMIDVMVQSNEQDESVRPDARTINGLLTAAIEHDNPLFAERINSLALELGLRPNAITYSLLLEARTAGEDAVGAASAFDDLIHCTPLIGHSIKIINQYIRQLCSASPLDYNQVLNVLSHVERREVELEPDTVVGLCLMFLKNDKAHEVIDTLSLHVKQFSMDDRKVILNSLLKYCLDRSVSTARAWDCYSLLRQFFPETSREERISLMESFFDRKRADMACYIFGHMRAHANDAMRPDLNTYVTCLEGLGACPDAESVQMIHNMFKMDTKIQPTTRLYNAFMIAYTACDDPSQAFDFWRQISMSTEGPSYHSMNIVFRVCQVLPYGDEKAKIIWEKMHRMEIDIPIYVYCSYIVMNAGQGHLDEVKALLSGMRAACGKEPDWYTVAEIFNAFPNAELQKQYREWIAHEFPEIGRPLSKTTKLIKTIRGTDRVPLQVRKLRAAQRSTSTPEGIPKGEP